VPIFSSLQQVTSSVGTVSSIIFDTDNTSTTTYGPLGSITAGDIWAQTGVVGQTTSCVVGLASIQNAVV